MEETPRWRRQLAAKPFFTFRKRMCAGEIQASGAPGLRKTQVQVDTWLCAPVLLMRRKASKKVVPFYTGLDEVFQCCRPQGIACFVGSKSWIESFLQDVDRIAITEAILGGRGRAA